MAGVGALAWLFGFSTWPVVVSALAALLAGAAVVSMVTRRLGSAPSAARGAGVPSPGGTFDPDEVIAQDATSGRVWRLRDVHFLGAAERRRLAVERPHVWRAYRARLFPLQDPSTQRVDDDPASRREAGPPGSESPGPPAGAEGPPRSERERSA